MKSFCVEIHPSIKEFSQSSIPYKTFLFYDRRFDILKTNISYMEYEFRKLFDLYLYVSTHTASQYNLKLQSNFEENVPNKIMSI